MTRPYKRWSRDEVISTIRELQTSGIPLNSGYVARTYPALTYAGRKYVGSWERAVAAAGFDYEQFRRKNIWSRKRVIARIRELYKAGEELHVSRAEREHGGLVGAAAAHFRSWGRAIKAAGLDYAKIKRQREWSKPVIITEIRRMHRRGMSLRRTTEVRQQYRTLHAACVRYFGSWAAAVRAAGLGRCLAP